ncbi:radical SAM protein [Bradyrhizobium sediminis]|uniref:Radical SAM protein n=1 Tax=Bradyrhizobium sediminis TaxID=2840469 RepID=A0A975RN72_9BRAD|nr:radical SAM protein [Bradyrhizobium sediminis]QWG14175.1 radical SAM protein [Bradyrhizobium sediminis]
MLKRSRYVQELDLSEGRVLLANLLWRTYLELGIEDAAIWRDAKVSAAGLETLPQPLREQLGENKMLVDPTLDEADFMMRRYERMRFSFDMLGLTIAPTIDCNFACVYCYENKRPGRMSRLVEDQIIEYVRRFLPGRKTLSVTWYGGEPLMGKETIYRLSEAFIGIASELGASYQAFMVTNGYLLRADAVDRLRELGHWRTVQVTLDGDATTHDVKRPSKAGSPTFERVVDNLTYAAGQLPMVLRMNVDTLNPDGCHRLLELLAARGLAGRLRIAFAPIHPFGQGCHDIAEKEQVKVATNEDFAATEIGLVAHAKLLGFSTSERLSGPWLQQCQAVTTHSIVVEPDGSLQRCWLEVGENDKRVGHITRAMDLSDERNLRWLRFDPTRDDPCRSCNVLPVCFGGCPHRHVEHAPSEFTCNQIRYNLREMILFEYLAKHRPTALAEMVVAQAAGSRWGSSAAKAGCGNCTARERRLQA